MGDQPLGPGDARSDLLFVTLTLTHSYFAVRPDKFWLTKSMVLGYVDRNSYLEHHDPERWIVSQETTKG